jgi:hypothetical protein
MPTKNDKFILTTDELTAKIFIAAGFKLLSQSGGGYIFINQPPKTFSFEQLDRKKFVFTNKLTF